MESVYSRGEGGAMGQLNRAVLQKACPCTEQGWRERELGIYRTHQAPACTESREGPKLLKLPSWTSLWLTVLDHIWSALCLLLHPSICPSGRPSGRETAQGFADNNAKSSGGERRVRVQGRGSEGLQAPRKERWRAGTAVAKHEAVRAQQPHTLCPTGHC